MPVSVLFRESWEIFKARWKTFVGTVLLFYAIYLPVYWANTVFVAAPTADSGQFGTGHVLAGLFFSLAGAAVVILLTPGMLMVFIRGVAGEKTGVRDLFAGWRLGLRFLAVSVVVGFICLAGFVLFVLPGIYFFYRLRFATYFVAGCDAGISESLRLSWEKTKGHILRLFAIDLLTGLIVSAGFLFFFVGFIPALAFANVVRARYFAELAGILRQVRDSDVPVAVPLERGCNTCGCTVYRFPQKRKKNFLG